MDLTSLTLKQLVDLFNQHSDKPTKKFSDRKSAIRRTLAVLPGAEPKPEPKPETDKPKATRNRKRVFEADAKAEKKAPRADSKRAIVLAMLLKGTTHAEVMETIGWDGRTAAEGIRLVNKACGYGLSTDEDGTIVAYD